MRLIAFACVGVGRYVIDEAIFAGNDNKEWCGRNGTRQASTLRIPSTYSEQKGE